MTNRIPAYDVVIVGGGPSGLSAALILARACRRVLICDDGTPRNWASKAIYGFLTRDGITPSEFRRCALRDLKKYKNVSWAFAHVRGAQRQRDATFKVLIKRRQVRTRKLLVATGVIDQLPPIRKIESFFGISVFQCPYCDGWEVRGKPIAVYGEGRRGLEMARALTAWTSNIVLCTNGGEDPPESARLTLRRNRIPVYRQRIARLHGGGGKLRAIELTDGTVLRRAALFFDTSCTGQSKLAESLGCRFTPNGRIQRGKYEATSVPGLFISGNIIKDVQLAVVAAAEGARAAFGINRSLTREDLDK